MQMKRQTNRTHALYCTYHMLRMVNIINHTKCTTSWCTNIFRFDSSCARCKRLRTNTIAARKQLNSLQRYRANILCESSSPLCACCAVLCCGVDLVIFPSLSCEHNKTTVD